MRGKKWSVVALVVIGATGGAAITFAATATTTKLVEACYKTSGGTLYMHALVNKPGRYPCRRGYAPVSWNQAGPAGPAGTDHVFNGQLLVNENKSAGTKIQRSATLIAETPELLAGKYAVQAEANLDLEGLGFGQCFVAVVSATPHDDGNHAQAYEAGTDHALVSAVVNARVLGVKAHDRIGFYCKDVGAGQPNSSDYIEATGGDLTATLATHLSNIAILRGY